MSYFIVGGKGDNNVDFYSYDPSTQAVCNKVGSYRFKDTTQALNMLPKHGVDVNVNEIGRCVRIGFEKTLNHHAFRIPMKGGFQDEFYPPFMSNKAANTAEAWASGDNKPPLTVKLMPEKKAKKTGSGLAAKLGGVSAAPTEETKTAGSSEDVAALKKEIADLKAQLAAKSSSTTDSGPAEDLTTKPVLGYWAIRGLAQQLRTQLAYCGVEFEDKTYDVTGDADAGWDRSAWLDVKFTLGMDYPNLPYMIDGDAKITETAAIHKYIAKKWKPELLGRTAAEMGRVEMLAAHVLDIKMKCTIPAYRSEKDAQGVLDEIADEVHPILTTLVEKTDGKPWIAGDNLTWLDFFWAEVLEYMDSILDGRFSAEFPSTREYLDRFKALDAVKAYNESDKCFKGPWNNKMAKVGQL